MPPIVLLAEQIILNRGTMTAVITYTKGRVLKTHCELRVNFVPSQPSIKALIRERKIYEALGTHTSILEYFDPIPMDNDGGAHGLWLERAEYDTIRAILQGKVELPDKVLKDSMTRWRWIFQLISGLVHLHAHSFIHCDISCRNIIVTSSLDAKLIDFGGSAALEADGLVVEEAHYSCPSMIQETKLPSFHTDIFALGSAMYEILTDSPPYSDISSDEAENRFKELQFPETVNLRGGNVILDCWKGKFETVEKVK